MDWSDSEQQAAFRAEVRGHIEATLPQRYRDDAASLHSRERPWEFDRGSDDPEAQEAARQWTKAPAERGWVAPHWPTGCGREGPRGPQGRGGGEDCMRSIWPACEPRLRPEEVSARVARER